jgi:TolA-binding protein
MGLPGLSSGEGGFAQAETPLRSPISFAPPETDVIGPLGGAEAAVAEAAAPGSSADDELASLFDHSEDDLSAPGGAQGEPMQTSTPTGYDSATSPFSRPSMPSAMSSAGGDVGALVQDLERRMKQLESQVEELIETKERLERQVAAQTEELRVQRAAIARTQRVLRTVVKPEEEATEPVPKV